MKILLINPTRFGMVIQNDPIIPRCPGLIRKGDKPYSLGMLYIAATLKKNNYDVSYLDFSSLTPRNPVKKILEFKPDVIIINSCQTSFEYDKRYIRTLRKFLRKEVHFVAVGIFPIIRPELFLREDFIDYIIDGEPEFTILELIDSLKMNIINENISKINGLIYLGKNQQLLRNEPRSTIENLDELPFPLMELIDLKEYNLPYSREKRFAQILASRGCPYQCTFCMTKALYGKTVRYRSPKNVIQEILWLNKTYNIREFHFWDDTLTINSKFVDDFCNQLIALQKKGFFIKFTLGTRVDHIQNPDLVMKLKKAGAYLLKFGIESGDPAILKSIKKDIKLNQVIRAVSLSRKYGLDVLAYFMLGFPGETIKTIRQTIDFAAKLNLDYAVFNYVIPWVGTEIYDQVKDSIGDIPLSDFTGEVSIIPLKGLSRRKMKRLLIYAYLRLFLHKNFILNQIRSIDSVEKLKYIFKSLLIFLNFIF